VAHVVLRHGEVIWATPVLPVVSRLGRRERALGTVHDHSCAWLCLHGRHPTEVPASRKSG